MILDKYIQVRWNQNNKKYYINQGYSFTKIGDIFTVDINDLIKGSHTLVNVICDVCGLERKMQYKEYCNNIENGNYYACSRKCGVDKKINTVLKRYGVRNVSQLETIKNKKMETNLMNYDDLYTKLFPKYNEKSINYLNLISKRLNIPIQHALNGGEKKFVRYWVDGYIEKYNICIEWDERQHNLKRKKERDDKKDVFLKEKFNCTIIRINEKNFLKDINNQINYISENINNIIKNN